MSVWNGIGRVFGVSKREPRSAGITPPGKTERASMSSKPAASETAGIHFEPVAIGSKDAAATTQTSTNPAAAKPASGIELAAEDLKSTATLAPPPKNKQEVIAELRKSYDEVLGLVRKVDQHLDRAEERAKKLMQLADDTSRRLEVLPELNEQQKILVKQNEELRSQNAMMTRAINGLAAAGKQSHERTERSLKQHANAMVELKGTIGGGVGRMTDATDKLSTALTEMRAADAKREERLAEMIGRSQRAMLVAVGVCGVLAAGMIIAVIALA